MNILLSICVPTYNGGSRIKECVDCIVRAIGNREDIELIISDNASTDSTEDLLKQYNKYPFFSYYRNERNLGFNGNMARLIDIYAKGRYCWLLGDDDFLDSDALNILCPILESFKYNYISINFRTLQYEKWAKFKNSNKDRSVAIETGSYFSVIDNIASIGNVLNTFTSTQIFSLAKIRAYDKAIFIGEEWKGFRIVFPCSYMMTETFSHEDTCGMIKEPLITAIVHTKTYSDKWQMIVQETLPDYFNYCLHLAENKSALKRNRFLIRQLKHRALLQQIRKGKINQNDIFHLVNPYFWYDIMLWGIDIIHRIVF